MEPLKPHNDEKEGEKEEKSCLNFIVDLPSVPSQFVAGGETFQFLIVNTNT